MKSPTREPSQSAVVMSAPGHEEAKKGVSEQSEKLDVEVKDNSNGKKPEETAAKPSDNYSDESFEEDSKQHVAGETTFPLI